MKLPRDLSSQDLLLACRQLGYEVTRQTGSHIRLTTMQNGQHHITIPNHDSLRIGTLSAILSDIAKHFNRSKSEIIEQLFG